MIQLNCITYNKISMKIRHNFYIKKCSVEVQYTGAGEKTLLVQGVALSLDVLVTETVRSASGRVALCREITGAQVAARALRGQGQARERELLSPLTAGTKA